ncbi:MAG: glutamate--cysteine ligase [Gemmatimonadaceae bacterium]
MAIAITKDTFSDEDRARFATRLIDQVAHLSRICDEPSFGEGPTTLGAELEVPIVGADQRPCPCNTDVLRTMNEPRATVEIARFNVEFNCTPVAAAGRPFTAIGDEVRTLLAAGDEAASVHGARLLPVGILPSVMPEDVTRDAMTDVARYRALERQVGRMRGGPAHITIHGEEPLSLEYDGVMLEGANTSFQLHLRASAARFADTYNAAQLATPIAVALSGNSPVFLDHLLWDETRVAVFKQSVEARTADDLVWRRPARVAFGHGWARRGAPELFAEGVRLHEPLFPVCDDAAPDRPDARAPRLAELRLHQGTIWRWNRAIYDPSEGGHLRIEFRALPSGPTVLDMMANAALLIGLTVGIRDSIDGFIFGCPFLMAEMSFYRAARDGMDAVMLWPDGVGTSPKARPVRELADSLLPLADQGLATLGVESEERARLLGVIADRVASGQTGARWQRSALRTLRTSGPRRAALDRLVREYAARYDSQQPVHLWPAVD